MNGCPADTELVAGFYCFIAIEMYLYHFFAGNVVVKLILQNGNHFPRFYVDHLSAGGIGKFAVEAERNPPGHVAQWNAGELLKWWSGIEYVHTHIVPIA